MKFRISINICILLIVSSLTVFGQLDNINIRRISPPGGFTLNAIYTIKKDNLGFIWMGTRQGLIRYNSNNTTWFIPSTGDSTSLISEIILDLLIDRNNNVWIATSRGLCKFDRSCQSFKKVNYRYDNNQQNPGRVNSLLETEEGNILLTDNNYFGKLDLKTNILKPIGSDSITSPRFVYKDDFNRYWISDNSGEVFRYNDDTKKVKKVIGSNSDRINTLYTEPKRIWLGTQNEGIKIYDLEGNLIKHLSLTKEKKPHRFSETIRDIKKDTYGRVWIAAYEGLFAFDGNKINRLRQDEHPGLPHNSIYEIYEDEHGEIWIGTWAGGLALIHNSDNYFQTFRHSKLFNSISDNVVSSFVQISDDEILLGTEIGGLNSYNPITGKFKTISMSDSYKVENIKSLCKDKYEGVWVGTFRNGLWYRPPGSKKFTLFPDGEEDGKHVSYPSIYSINAVDSGVWISTFKRGVNFYSFNTKSIRFCFNDGEMGRQMSRLSVQSVFTDSKSNLWIGSNNSLIKVDLKKNKINQIEITNSNTNFGNDAVYCFWEHPLGDIWIGTKNRGILIYHPETDNIESFDANGLLKGKDVMGIIKGQNNQIWISSNNGLIVYDQQSKTTRQFGYSDGIQGNMFNTGAVFKDTEGILYFGGTNGFTRINPEKLKRNTRKPHVFINELITKENKYVYPKYSKSLEPEPIRLNPEENTFRINFAANNFLMPEKNQYKYRLVNYYDDWLENKNNGTVLFTSLKSGEYIFEVVASNNDGIWGDKTTKLNIIVSNYWYRTKTAFAMYLLLLLFILFLIGRFYSDRVKLKRAVLLEKNQREAEEQLHEMKLRFFTNISHEFRTPLNLILWPLRKLSLANNITSEQKVELEIVNRNTNRLLNLINQLIDLRKLEKGKSELNLSRFDIVNLVTEIHKGFESEDKSKNMKFTLDSPIDKLEIEADREKIDIILYNLLSNAYKYNPPKGNIRISINTSKTKHSTSYTNQLSFGKMESDEFVEIAVKDSGIGIESEDLLKIFNRFEQGKSNSETKQRVKGSGIGLSICKDFTLLHNGVITAQSHFGEGSRFVVLLPLKQKARAILFESYHDYKDSTKTNNSHVKLKTEKQPEELSQILIVEDNADFRTLVGKSLQQYYQVEYANNGEEALEILTKKMIDVVVSDVMMPKMDGFEMCKIIKTNVETSHIPVILLTALATNKNQIDGLEKGADVYLTKPFQDEVLLKQIDNILEQRRRIRNNFRKQFVSQKVVQVGSLDNFFLNRVRTTVEENINDENFGMEQLAKELMISRSQLHRKIKSLSGLTTTEFVNLIRIKKAAELIKNENYLFNEVAYKVGFNSQSYFSKCFKKVYNTTPKKYFSK